MRQTAGTRVPTRNDGCLRRRRHQRNAQSGQSARSTSAQGHNVLGHVRGHQTLRKDGTDRCRAGQVRREPRSTVGARRSEGVGECAAMLRRAYRPIRAKDDGSGRTSYAQQPHRTSHLHHECRQRRELSCRGFSQYIIDCALIDRKSVPGIQYDHRESADIAEYDQRSESHADEQRGKSRDGWTTAVRSASRTALRGSERASVDLCRFWRLCRRIGSREGAQTVDRRNSTEGFDGVGWCYWKWTGDFYETFFTTKISKFNKNFKRLLTFITDNVLLIIFFSRSTWTLPTTSDNHWPTGRRRSDRSKWYSTCVIREPT